ncbi:hypothetical protein GCM10020000_38000 [Streptomyces olivoverticillatus]
MWPDILEAVKNRRRFTWILLSQNAQVVGFDGTTVQVGFATSGARDSFANSGSEEVLRQAISDRLGVQWKVELLVDPSGGATPPAGAGAVGGFGGGAPAAPRPQFQAAAPAPPQPVPQAAAPAPEPYRPPAAAPSGPPVQQHREPEPPPVAPPRTTCRRRTIRISTTPP